MLQKDYDFLYSIECGRAREELAPSRSARWPATAAAAGEAVLCRWSDCLGCWGLAQPRANPVAATAALALVGPMVAVKQWRPY